MLLSQSAASAQPESPPPEPLAEDVTAKVEDFLKRKPSKEEILAASKKQKRYKLGPVDEMPVQDCGTHPMARIYSPNEVVRRLHLQHPPCFGPVDDELKEFNLFVTEHAERMRVIKQRMQRRPHKRLRLAYITWNALLVKPNTLAMLAAFLNGEQGLDLNSVDVLAILLQENVKLEGSAERLLLDNMQHTLNALSNDPNWSRPTIAYLDNLIGTQAKVLFQPNTQTMILAHRSTHKPTRVCQAANALFRREKGFIGAVLDIPGMGALAVMGAHLKGWDVKPFNKAMNQIVKQCGNTQLGEACECLDLLSSMFSPSSGLNSFSLGMVYGGDWNEHFHTDALSQLYANVVTHPDRYPAFQKPEVIRKETPSNLKMTELLLEALTEPLAIIDRDYQPLLWSVDRLGRSVEVEGSPPTLPGALRHHGFSLISACYRAGITYKWQRGCPYPSGTPEPGHSPFQLLKPCLASKVLESPRGAGYLDRAVVRLPASSREALDQLIEADTPESGQLPAKFASIIKGAVVYNLQSDHLMVASLIEFISLE
ncbi:hypothetical protein Efla_002686 [Eimeria flavescens]